MPVTRAPANWQELLRSAQMRLQRPSAETEAMLRLLQDRMARAEADILTGLSVPVYSTSIPDDAVDAARYAVSSSHSWAGINARDRRASRARGPEIYSDCEPEDL